MGVSDGLNRTELAQGASKNDVMALLHSNKQGVHYRSLFKRSSCPLTSPQPNCLTEFLQFCQKLITLLHKFIVLPVLVIRSVGFNHTIDSVNGTVELLRRNELRQITMTD